MSDVAAPRERLSSGPWGSIGAFLYDTRWLGLRSLRRFLRVPAWTVGIVAFPLIQLFVFSQLFRGIVALPEFAGTDSYLAYLAPGQLIFAVFIAVTWSSGGLLLDHRTGYLDKLRSTPTQRYAIVAGELVTLFVQSALMGAIILAVTALMGAPIASGLPGMLLILLVAGAFGVAWAGTSMAPALLTRSEQATTTLSFLFMPLAFMSTAFVPRAMMPEWLQSLDAFNPISHVIEAIRSLMSVGIIWSDLWPAIASIALLGLVLHTVTLWAFRRLAA
jgi:ABC-2 type transport system permease protein